MPEENNDREIKIAVCGRSYTESGAPLQSSLNVISGYQESFQYCLNISAKRFATKEIQYIIPSIKLSEAKIGSLDVSTFVDFAVSASIGVTLNPDIRLWIQWAWELYNKASEFISSATSFFNRENTPVTIHIQNSPGAMPFVMVAGRDITTTTDVINAARNIHKNLNSIASEVINDRAERVTITHNNDIPFVINDSNKNSFLVKHLESIDPEPVEFRCGLYSINKHTRTGKLQFLDDTEENKIFSFSIEGDQDIETYIDGLKAHYSIINATREMQVTALGELKIKRLQISAIENYQD